MTLKLTLLCVSLFGSLVAEQDPLDWWKTTVIYQIYPLSFKDNSGDGTGDLQGITEKLDHVKDIGAGAIWINPFFTSGLEAYGYAMTNYCDVDPVFGTLDDWNQLAAKAKELDIKLILDLVPNHSSYKHYWFDQSIKRVDPYTDYYVWRDAKINGNGEREPPTNWIATTSGSAWTWNDDRQQYYLHQFAPNMPDLNWRNQAVKEEFKNVFRFWFARGADGFRVDAVPHLIEDAQFRDEVRSDNDVPPTDWGYLVHNYTTNQPETYELIQEWRAFLDSEFRDKDNHTRLIVTEAYATVEQTMKYFGTATNPGAHFPFNFNFISYLNSQSSAQDYNNVIHMWMDNVPEGMHSNWVAGNHDQHRVSARFGTELKDAVNMMMALLPGTAITYYGEEIGMDDANIGGDASAPERTPYQWDDSTSAGFSTNENTWLPVNTNYKDLNLAKEQVTDRSYYHVYKKLLEARQTETIKNGQLYTNVIANNNVFSFSRELEGADTYVMMVNLGGSTEHFDITSVYPTLADYPTVLTSSVTSNFIPGTTVSKNDLTLSPKEAVVLTSQK